MLVAHLAAVLDARRRSDRQVLGAWSIAVGGGLAPVVPLVVLARTQAQQIAWNTPAWNDIAAMPYMLFRSPVVTAVALGGAGVALVAAFRRRRGNEPDPGPGPDFGSDSRPGPGSDTRLPTRLTPVALWALAPFLLTVATARWLHLLLDRCLLFTVPALILLTNIGIHRFTARPQVVRRVATALVAVIAAFAPFDRSAVTRNTLPASRTTTPSPSRFSPTSAQATASPTPTASSRAAPWTSNSAKAPGHGTPSCMTPRSSVPTTRPGRARTPASAGLERSS